jgi:Arc/MetJ-type ribon-helix-helix transcriptional regulator
MNGMKASAPRTKVSVTIRDGIVSSIDDLVREGRYESRSAAFEAAATHLLRARQDELIEAEVAKLDRDAEMREAEEALADFSGLVRE